MTLLIAGRVYVGFAGAVSRTATAPVDRLKLLLQIQDTSRGLTIRDGFNRMAAEGGLSSRSIIFRSTVTCTDAPIDASGHMLADLHEAPCWQLPSAPMRLASCEPLCSAFVNA